MPGYYPAMLDVRGRRALIVGGDRLASEKAAALHASGAQITLLASQFCVEALEMERAGDALLLRKSYERGDLAGAFVVVGATNDPVLIEAIWEEAQERGQLVNIVDVPARCNFILPSVLRRGQLTIAVSTEGASPALAKRIRQGLEKQFPPAYDQYMHLAGIVRASIKQHGLSYWQRDEFFGDFFTSDILTCLTAGDEARAVETAVKLLERHGVEVSETRIQVELREAVHSYGNHVAV